MSLVAFEFEEIKAEVEIYFSYLEKIDDDGARLVRTADADALREPFGREFKTILKANALLLLYHLVEATVQRSIDGIIEAVSREKLGYADVSDKVRKVWSSLVVRRLRRASEDKWVDQLNQMFEDCLKKEILMFSGREILKSQAGNIDADAIRIIADNFGFEFITRPAAKGGDDLTRIRHSRNQLAHGVQKFTQVGGEMTVTELREMKDRVVGFLEDLISCADLYVKNKSFKVA